MATTRLRRTFKYPSDADFSNEVSDIDEEEQDALITSLQTQSQSTDIIYIRIFSLLPLVCIPAYLFFAFRPIGTSGVRFVCVLAITSLISSSLSMFMTPVGVDGKVKNVGVLDLPVVGEVDSDGPLGRTLPLLNPVICGLLIIVAWGMRRRAAASELGVPESFWLFCLLPSVILGVVVFAKKSIKEVEEGIDELSRLRYGLKGA